MLKMIKRHFHDSIKKPIKRALIVLGKPELPYLEFHLTDHCNLNCKGCGHFSPIAAPYYASVAQYELDLSRLTRLFRNIQTIRLMGGEPLLHPDAAAFIAITHRLFPQAHLKFVTNGILLASAPEIFWEKCNGTHTTIDLTVYPLLRSRAEHVRSLCKSKGVSLETTEVDRFFSIMNLSGSSDQFEAYKTCRSKLIGLPLLRNGRLYQCAGSALIHHFNNWFKYDIPADPGLDIYEHFLSGKKILQLLERPTQNCKYCTFDSAPFPWGTSSKSLDEWIAVPPVSSDFAGNALKQA